MSRYHISPFITANFGLGAGARLYPIACLLLLALLLALHAPVSHAGSCVAYDTFDESDGYQQDFPTWNLPASGTVYVNFSSTFMRGPARHWYDTGCSKKLPAQEAWPNGAVLTNSRDTAWNLCQANNSKVIRNVWTPSRINSRIWQCEVGSEDAPKRPGDPTEPRRRRQYVGAVYNQPGKDAALAACQGLWPSTTLVEPMRQLENAWTCWSLWIRGEDDLRGIPEPSELPMSGLNISAASGLGSGIEFKRVSSGAVGIQSVIDMGFLDAVDVWSNVGGGAEICFPQVGNAVLLDASTSPRKVVPLNTTQKAGATCVTINKAGTVVLVNASTGAQGSQTEETSSSSRDTPTVAGTNDAVNSATPLQNCQVTPQFTLRLRSEPWGSRLGAVPAGATVTAIGRTSSWFNVTYAGKTGWIAAWLATTNGNCG